MALELDLSAHTLNNSTSKHKFSFPKSERFRDLNGSLCDSYYQIPSTRSRRATSFGYGNKSLGLKIDKFTPPIGTYELGSEFKKETKHGFSFGQGRDEMEIGGPLKQAKIRKFVPGPGTYQSKSGLQDNTITLKSRIPDRSINHLLKNPGPGTYACEELGSKMYYATSKHRNYTNARISATARLQPISKRNKLDVGPGTYSVNREDIQPLGRYALSNHQSSRTRIFDKSPRAQLLYKHMVGTPGPGQYKPFSDFGNV